jgi:hypothetical protein
VNFSAIERSRETFGKECRTKLAILCVISFVEQFVIHQKRLPAANTRIVAYRKISGRAEWARM